MRPRVAITVGDPAGIGPEIARKASADARVTSICEPILYGPSTDDELRPFPTGRVSADAGRAAYDAIVKAVCDAQQRRVAAVVTAPVSKEAFALAGLPWRGHTDLLQHLTSAGRVAMLFHSDALTVTLATVHVPLAEVPRALTPERLRDAIDLTAEWLPRVGVARPRLAVAGLNPHAGEHGVIGHEDRDVIEPVVAACRARGLDVSGPLPADTLFARAIRREHPGTGAPGPDHRGTGAPGPDFDAVVACYHDQGLIPIKLVAFGRAVNVTIGLPIVRTSVDHGTAFDIAGTGVADPSSLIEAIRLAVRLCRAPLGGARLGGARL